VQGEYLLSMRLDLTMRADYAIRAMLALTRAGEIVSSRRIAEEMKIPPRFLPQIMGDLTRAGLVQAHPGRSGGYALAEDPAGVTLLAVIEAVEGDPHRQICVMRGTPCGEDGECGVHDIFFAAETALLERLGDATLKSVIDKYEAEPVKAG
jgi:Rrf2 family transcriptional regulator, iron-sulfur cluster assembly transcription factor